MKIKCIHCQNEFKQQLGERSCGCQKDKRYDGSSIYLSKTRRYYLDVIHTWFKEFIYTEEMPHHRVGMYKHAIEKGWDDGRYY